MEKQVIFRDDQYLLAEDTNNVQRYTADSLEHIVEDAITTGRYYVGFAATFNPPVTLYIAPGHLWDSGKVYVNETETQFNLFPQLPVTNRKKIAVFTYGNEVETEIQPRMHLLNPVTRQSEPRTVAMQLLRRAEVSTAAGVESADPQLPTLSAGQLLIAIVTLDPAGIVSIEMVTQNRLPQLDQVNSRVKVLEAFRTDVGPRIEAITTDLSKLQQGLANAATIRQFIGVAGDVARLKLLANLPSTYAAYDADKFINTQDTDATQVGYSALVDEGVRLPWAAQTETSMTLFNALDPAVINLAGFVMPAHDLVTKLSVTEGFAGDIALSQAQAGPHQTVQKTIARRRLRYGKPYTRCSNIAYLLGREASNDDILAAYKGLAPGEVFNYTHQQEDPRLWHSMTREDGFWLDEFTDPYWAVVPSTATISGSQHAQTFMNTQDGWMRAINLYFTQVAPDGIVNVLLCEAELGQPQLNKVVASATVTPANMRNSGPTPVGFIPIYMVAGRRYAIVVITTGNHRMAVVSGNKQSNGTLFRAQDGAYFVADPTKNMMFSLTMCEFRNPYTEVMLNSLQLSGGMNAIDLLYVGVTPRSTRFELHAQVNNVWHPLDRTSLGANILGSLPPLLPLKAVFIGTKDVMPGVSFGDSKLFARRPALAFEHWSTERVLSTGSTTIKVQELLENFNGSNHAFTCQLKQGASTVNPALVENETTDTGIRRTFTFNFGSPITSYRIRKTGTVNNAHNPYHVAERIDIAL